MYIYSNGRVNKSDYDDSVGTLRRPTMLFLFQQSHLNSCIFGVFVCERMCVLFIFE